MSETIIVMVTALASHRDAASLPAAGRGAISQLSHTALSNRPHPVPIAISKISNVHETPKHKGRNRNCDCYTLAKHEFFSLLRY
ncbi:unnamed protein product, partial [Iphiclides podalirius]